jgi:hypothetical protein
MIGAAGGRHLLPHFAREKVADIDLAAVMEWLDKQRAAGELGEASIRHRRRSGTT